MTAPAERTSAEVPAPGEPRRWRSWLAFEERGIAAATLLFFVVGAVSSPYFLTLDNLTGILQSLTFLGFLAIGVGLTLMAGEIDISVGSVFGLAAVVTALSLHRGSSLALAIAEGLGTGLACGFANGAVAELIRVPAVVVTLATLGVYRALALVLAGGSPVTGMPPLPGFFDTFGQGTVADVSVITLLFLGLALVAELVLRRTAFGFRLLAIGSNPLAAHLVGFHVGRTRLVLLVLSGFMAALSGVCSVAYLHTAGPTAGTGYELSVLAAVIIGGVQLTGGRGSVLGILLGLAVIGIIQNLIVLWGIPPSWTQGVSGMVLIASMALTWFSRRGETGAPNRSAGS
ncbi:MAG TPA: ABC transporter permease [Acetobacteraceae bacterium]|jgi:ribose transport system permease protein|nr:ABC transporter permease [Acetobacteraceae bacterium]